MKSKKLKKIIVSVCSRDIIYVLSVYENKNSLIITSSSELFQTYKEFKLNVLYTKNSIQFLFKNKRASIYFFGQGNRFDIIILSFLKKYFNKYLTSKIYYKDCYINHLDKVTVSSFDLIFPKFQMCSYRLFGMAICGDIDPINLQKKKIVYKYFWVDLMQDNIPLNFRNYKIQLPSDSIVILIEPKILDVLDLALITKNYKVYLKPHYIYDHGIKKEDLSQYGIILNKYLPFELFYGYKYVIGLHSTCLNDLNNSISLSPLVGAIENARVATTIYSLKDFYNHINIICD